MNRSDRSRRRLILGLLGLIALLLLIGGLAYSSSRNRALNSRPLVLIHSPINREQVSTGEGVIVHSTARASSGLARMELWVDDALIADQDAPEGSAPTNLTLSAPWVPQIDGNHMLIVRAFSTDGTEGQATVMISALESGEMGMGTHIVEEGDTLESIAEEHGTSPEELTDLNPGIDPGGPAPGDELVVPDDEPTTEDEGPPVEDGGEELPVADSDEAPLPDVDPPGSLDLGDWLVEMTSFVGEADRVTLRVEIPTLYTGQPHDGFHCYVELAGSPPQWYPDIDNDQSTDESFEPLDGDWWDTASNLEGDSAPIVAWPGDQALPMTVSCVGVNGGAEALELGRVEISIPPEEWNGVPYGVDVLGEEGLYSFTYRVTYVDSTPRGVPLVLDRDMTSPTNVRLDDRRISLRWDYDPAPPEEGEEPEEPIDGFGIYLNGNLQWTEAPDSRESGLPYEWFNPPCGTRYTFSVTAFRIGLPHGPESYPSYAFIETPAEDCTREIQITFLSLETFDLGNDGNSDDTHGDIGPVYGQFYANERQLTFDGGNLGLELDLPNGLRHNTLYDLGEMSADPIWRFITNSTIVDIPEDGTFNFGFTIMDRDYRSDHSICDAHLIYVDNYGDLDRIHEDWLMSDNGRCRLTYQWGPAFGSPVGTGGEGFEPLPWIELTDFVVDEASGEVQIHIRNTGTATWPWRDLNVELQTRSGESIGVYSWQLMLETGARTVLTHPDMVLSSPFDACVLIDPYDDVPEEFERSAAMRHVPICLRLPDLTITDAFYDPDAFGRVRVTVRNIGEGSIDDRTVVFETLLPDGSPIYPPFSFSHVSLEPNEMRVFDLGGVGGDPERPRMQAGYSVVVNPEATIHEANSDNNTFEVLAANRLTVGWYWIEAPHAVRNTVEFYFDAYVISGGERRQVADWHIGQDINWGSCWPGGHCVREFRERTPRFDIYGDELLEITVRATHPGTLVDNYMVSHTYGSINNWGAESPSPGDCVYNASSTTDHGWSLGWLAGEDWYVYFRICRDH